MLPQTLHWFRVAEELRGSTHETLLPPLAVKMPRGPSNAGNRGLSLGGDRGYSAINTCKHFAEQLATLGI